MRQIPKAYERYRHFKGNTYQILLLAEHTETGEGMVIYQALYGDFRIYARPLDMFMGRVDKEKYPDAAQEFRFQRIGGEGADRLPPAPAEEAQRAGGLPCGQPEALAERLQEPEEESREGEASGLDPFLLEFLDADSYEKRLNILAALRHRITDDMINVMAMATDLEVAEGDIEERYVQLRACLLKLARFECSR